MIKEKVKESNNIQTNLYTKVKNYKNITKKINLNKLRRMEK